jgi:hypothetical protein
LRSIRGRRSAIIFAFPSKKPLRASLSESSNIQRPNGFNGLIAPYLRFVAATKFAFGILALTARLLKYPLPILLSLYILTMILARISMGVTATVCSSPFVSFLCPQQHKAQYSLAPQTFSAANTPDHTSSSARSQLCSTPIIRLLCSQSLADKTHEVLPKTDLSHLLGAAGEKVLGTLLNETMQRASLSTQLRKADMAAVDLLSVVQQSSLISRNELSTVLKTFSDEARSVAWQVQSFNIHVAGAVDG